MSRTGDTPNEESGSAYGVRRLAAALGGQVDPRARKREQAPALHGLRCAEEDAGSPPGVDHRVGVVVTFTLTVMSGTGDTPNEETGGAYVECGGLPPLWGVRWIHGPESGSKLPHSIG
jgi:hypothetical protein